MIQKIEWLGRSIFMHSYRIYRYNYSKQTCTAFAYNVHIGPCTRSSFASGQKLTLAVRSMSFRTGVRVAQCSNHTVQQPWVLECYAQAITVAEQIELVTIIMAQFHVHFRKINVRSYIILPPLSKAGYAKQVKLDITAFITAGISLT